MPRALGEACAVHACEAFRVQGSPLCPLHAKAWGESAQRMAAASAVLRFLRTAGAPAAPNRTPSRGELLRAADAILGADFGHTPSTDAIWKVREELPSER